MRFENKVMALYLKHIARGALDVDTYILKGMNKKQLEKVAEGNLALLPTKNKEDFIKWRWKRAERFYSRGPSIKINPLIRDAWFGIRSALEEWYMLQGYRVVDGRYEICVAKDSRVYRGIITPQMEVVFIGDRPHNIPKEYFKIYIADELGERAFPIYQKEIVSGLVPLLSGGRVNTTLVAYKI